MPRFAGSIRGCDYSAVGLYFPGKTLIGHGLQTHPDEASPTCGRHGCCGSASCHARSSPKRDYPDANPGPYAYSNSHGNSDSLVNPHAYSNSHAHSDANGNSDGLANTYAHSDPDSHAHPNTKPNRSPSIRQFGRSHSGKSPTSPGHKSNFQNYLLRSGRRLEVGNLQPSGIR